MWEGWVRPYAHPVSPFGPTGPEAAKAVFWGHGVGYRAIDLIVGEIAKELGPENEIRTYPKKSTYCAINTMCYYVDIKLLILLLLIFLHYSGCKIGQHEVT